MVFSSIPAYLDPSTWHQHHQQQHQQNQLGLHNGINNNFTNPNPSPLIPPQPLPPPQHPGAQPAPHSGSVRPGSMAERARMANMPTPEPLKCPRCDSTNTKFCYFNNYSLAQPRYFCKACRRYWTRGGTLRTVPVGGGRRRNKQRSSKATSSSKSAPMDRSLGAAATSSASSTPHHASMAETVSQWSMPRGLSNMRFMSPLPLSHNYLMDDVAERLGLTTYEPFPVDGCFETSLLYGNSFDGNELWSLGIGGSGGPVKMEERDGEMGL